MTKINYSGPTLGVDQLCKGSLNQMGGFKPEDLQINAGSSLAKNVAGEYTFTPVGKRLTNPSGIMPMEFNVLIDPDKVEEKTAGGLYKPQDATEREKHQQTKGTIVALSPLAFNADIYPDDMTKPQPGQRVAIALHAGAFIKGADGKEYRMVKDKDITALIAGGI